MKTLLMVGLAFLAGCNATSGNPRTVKPYTMTVTGRGGNPVIQQIQVVEDGQDPRTWYRLPNGTIHYVPNGMEAIFGEPSTPPLSNVQGESR